MLKANVVKFYLHCWSEREGGGVKIKSNNWTFI